MNEDTRHGPIRASGTWFFHCHADAGYFLPWEDVPELLKEELEAHGGLPCEGGGKPGWWCTDCRFGTDEDGGCTDD